MLSAIWPCMPRAMPTLVTSSVEVRHRPREPSSRISLLPRTISSTAGPLSQVHIATAKKMGGKRASCAMVAGTVALLALVLLSARGMEALEICNMDAEQLADCLPAIRGPSPPAPSDSCCAALRTADLPCLCRYKGSVILKSVGVDPKLAAALPTECNITSPPECSSVP